MSLSILIVEDEPLVAQIAGDLLAEMGHSVAARVASVEQAVGWLNGAVVDLVLLDFNLGNVSGLPVAEHAGRHGIPCIGVTGYDIVLLKSVHPGMQFLAKPYTHADLHAAIDGCGAVARG